MTATTSVQSESHPDPTRLQCMTVWGGNSATSKVFDVPGLRIWVHSRVHEDGDSGGDVYFLSSCASGRLTRLLLADVSGHGPAVSQTADSLRESMSANVNHINQERVVRSVNDEFVRSDNSDGFATAIVSTFFAPSRKLTLSNAGHPPPLLYRQAEHNWRVYSPDESAAAAMTNLPLGIVPDTQFEQSQLRLDSGDMLLIYTDAFYEARDERGEMLSGEGLLKLLAETDAAHPDRLIANLVNAISTMHPGNLISDDATIVLIQATDAGTPFWNSVTAPFRYVGGLMGLRPIRHASS